MEQAARIVGVGLIGLGGLIVSARVQDGVWHYAGLAILLGAVFFAFRLIDRAFHPPGAGPRPLVPVPAQPGGRLLAGGLAILLGLIGLFVAAGAEARGAAYHLGLGLTLLAWAYVFRLIAAGTGKQS